MQNEKQEKSMVEVISLNLADGRVLTIKLLKYHEFPNGSNMVHPVEMVLHSSKAISNAPPPVGVVSG